MNFQNLVAHERCFRGWNFLELSVIFIQLFLFQLFLFQLFLFQFFFSSYF